MHFVTAKSLEDQPIWYCGHWPRPRLQQATWSTVMSCQKREKAVFTTRLWFTPTHNSWLI